MHASSNILRCDARPTEAQHLRAFGENPLYDPQEKNRLQRKREMRHELIRT